jgi:hypothetical protein
VHWPQSEVIDENLAAQIEAQEALNASLLEPRIPSLLSLPSRDDEVAMEPNIDPISNVHWPQSEVIDENLAAQIETHEALNASVLEPRIPSLLPVCRCEALHLNSHACVEGPPCCAG